MKHPSRRRAMPSYRQLTYLIAIVLPVFCSATSVHFARFHSIPYALNFLAVAMVATMGGMIPSLVTVVSTLLSRAFFLSAGNPPSSLERADIARISVLTAAALLISLMTRNRRKAAIELEAAHLALQERSAALIESLHNSKCASWYHDFDTSESATWYADSYPVFGRPFSEVEKLASIVSFLHPDDRERLPAIIDRMKTVTEPVVWEYRVFWPDGAIHWLEMRATRVAGDAVIWRGLTVDITERKLAEEAVLRSEKLAAMGRLASTVAHEINNPLESVTNLLFLARSDATLSPDTAAYLQTAEQELARLGEITRLTLGFVRGSAVRHDLTIAAVVDDVLAVFRHRLVSRAIRVERLYEPGVSIHIAAHELRQILTNLISNSVDALGHDDPLIVVRIATERQIASLVVEDNGSGIAVHEIPYIFDAFFTTKEDVGTGIGLAVTRELVENNGGRISVESGDLANGMKTRFRVEFPLVAAPVLAE